ncbi:hypothetical protein BRADI_1g32901v3 [Brachypodium distachyon]|uniref:AT-hook motif nuclear-localized protein n=1 Tax=Brachypodium distachyon TaxID=15368 RepID=A0A2K2DME4_BRADI|nr:hypothetical protein BRADI_1g32901v3 [Brachypodium distachyon]
MSAEATYGVGLGLGIDLNKSPPKAELQLQSTVGAPADSPAQPPEPPLQTCSAPAKSASVDPRKYSLPLAILPAPQPAGAAPALPPGLANPQLVPPALSSPLQPSPSGNSKQRVKKRGRPPSSTGRTGPKVPATGSGVTGLYPQVIIVQAGEDAAEKIMSFSGNGWAVCIMSAIGAVSNVTVRASASFSPQTITYEGCFDILSLSGSYLPIERDRLSTHTRGLSILLAF